MGWGTWGRTGAAVVLGLAVSGCQWAQPLYDAGHSGDNPLERRLTAETVDGLGEAWSVGVVEPGGPVVADGTIVVRSGTQLLAYRGGLIQPAWTVDVADHVPEPPYPPVSVGDPSILGDDTVVVGVQSAGLSLATDSDILGFDLATGQAVELPHQPDRLVATTIGAPTVAGDALWGPYYVSLGGPDLQFVGASGTLADGRTVVAANQGSASGSFSPVAVGGGVAVYGTHDGRLEAIDSGGVEGCTYDSSFDVWACTPLWSLPLGPMTGSPVVRDGVVYATASGAVQAFTLPAGAGAPEPRWVASVPGGTAPAVTGDGDAFVGTAGGQLQAIAGAGCAAGADCPPAWVGEVGGPVTQAPTVAGDVVYVASGSSLVAFDADGCGAPTCAPLWAVATPGAVTSEVTVANGRVMVATTGAVVAYGLTP